MTTIAITAPPNKCSTDRSTSLTVPRRTTTSEKLGNISVNIINSQLNSIFISPRAIAFAFVFSPKQVFVVPFSYNSKKARRTNTTSAIVLPPRHSISTPKMLEDIMVLYNLGGCLHWMRHAWCSKLLGL
jgi:hypothetical protein